MSDPESLLKDFMGSEEMAKALNMHVRSLVRLHTERRGPPFIKLGGRKLYHRESVAKWLLSKQQEPLPERRIYRKKTKAPDQAA